MSPKGQKVAATYERFRQRHKRERIDNPRILTDRELAELKAELAGRTWRLP
jgi:hypothetical protein